MIDESGSIAHNDYLKMKNWLKVWKNQSVIAKATPVAIYSFSGSEARLELNWTTDSTVYHDTVGRMT